MAKVSRHGGRKQGHTGLCEIIEKYLYSFKQVRRITVFNFQIFHCTLASR